MITGGGGCVSRGSHPQGWGHSIPQIFGISYMCTHEGVTNFCVVIKLDEGIMFTGLTMLLPWPKSFVTPMLMCNLSVLADLLVSVNV